MEQQTDRATIRLANGADTPRILEIYTPYIERTPITFETQVPTAEEFAARMTHITQVYPVLVAEADERVIGYAYGQRQAARRLRLERGDLHLP